MQKRALQYYRKGYNCSQCILKAAESKYGLSLSEQCYEMCAGVKTGFGIGGMCSVVIAGVMVFGLMYDEATVKRLRLKLLDSFSEQFGSLNCATLKKERKAGMRCEELIYEAAGMIEKIIEEEEDGM